MQERLEAELSSSFVEVEGLELHLLEAGEGDAALLVHGWPTSSYLWRRMMPALGQARRVIAPDLPGFGKSAKPLDVSYSFRFYLRILDGLVERLGLDKVDLVVHDMGGPVALYWAVQHPEKIRSITFLNTVVFPELSWAVKAFVLATFMPGLNRLISSPAGVGRAIRFGLVNKQNVSDAELLGYTEPFVSRDAQKALLKSVHKLHPNGLKEIVAGLEKMNCPIRLLYAEGDRILPTIAKDMKRLQAMFPNALLSSYAEAGHFLQEEVPDELSEALLAFWRGNDAVS